MGGESVSLHREQQRCLHSHKRAMLLVPVHFQEQVLIHEALSHLLAVEATVVGSHHHARSHHLGGDKPGSMEVVPHLPQAQVAALEYPGWVEDQ